jgi:hypothetical protein
MPSSTPATGRVSQSGEREVVRFWRLGMGVFFGGSSSPEKAKSTSSVSGFSSF